VQYQEPAVLFAISIQDVKTLFEECAIAVHRHMPPQQVSAACWGRRSENAF
jgi:hypothetical protein